MKKQRGRTRGNDLRDHLNRLRARSQERMTNDLRELKLSIRDRARDVSRSPCTKATSDKSDGKRNRHEGARNEEKRTNRIQARDVISSSGEKNRKRARSRSRSPSNGSERPIGARELYRKIARRDGAFKDNEVRRALLEEEKLMDEERRTLWLEEEKRRTALIEEEEKRYERRHEEEDARRKRHEEDDEERRKLFLMEMKDMREKMQEALQDKMQEAMKEVMMAMAGK